MVISISWHWHWCWSALAHPNIPATFKGFIESYHMGQCVYLQYILYIIQPCYVNQHGHQYQSTSASVPVCISTIQYPTSGKWTLSLGCPSTVQDALETQRHQRHKAMQVSLKCSQSKVKNVDFPGASWDILRASWSILGRPKGDSKRYKDRHYSKSFDL